MILTIALIVKLFFKPTVNFILRSCEMEDSGDSIATRFETRGTTRWGSEVLISGDDKFLFKEGSCKIVEHQSKWDQSPQEVLDNFRGKF